MLNEIRGQPEVAVHFPSEQLSYEAQIEQLTGWLQEAGEYGLVYESIVSMLELFPFNVSGKAAIKLLEVGLKFGFKTDSEIDKEFDWR